jgi:hypothetical protein
MITRTREVKENGGFVETFTEEQSSASLNLNAKGQVQWDLKVYKDSPIEWANTTKAFLHEIKRAITEAEQLGLLKQ